MTKARGIIIALAAFAALTGAGGCTHVVNFDSTGDPIEVSVTIEVQQEIHVRLADAGA